MLRLRLVNAQDLIDNEEEPQPTTPRRELTFSEKRRILLKVCEEIEDGRIKTWKRARAILQISGIKLGEGEEDAEITEYLGYIESQFEEDNIDPKYKTAIVQLNIIASRKTYPGILHAIDQFEKDYVNEKYFPELKKEINVVRTLKKRELIKYFKDWLSKINKDYDEYRAATFRDNFFGGEYSPGAGLSVEDLKPSASERMTLHRIRLEEYDLSEYDN